MSEPKFRPEMHKTLRMRSFAAEAREFRVERMVPQYLIKQAPGVGVNAFLTSYIEQETNNMAIALHTHILGLDGEVELLMVSHEDVPLTWWDHFKSRFFEEWALRGRWPLKPIGRYIKNKWPAQYRTIDTEVKRTETRLCPHCTEKWPDNKRAHLEWLLGENER